MPGNYGPGGKWIHDRAHSLMESTKDQYGDKKGKEVAYAVATQMAHKLKKTPKPKGGYGTTQGRVEAKAKFNKPRSEYQKEAVMNPFVLQALFDELQKIAAEEEKHDWKKTLKHMGMGAAITGGAGLALGGLVGGLRGARAAGIKNKQVKEELSSNLFNLKSRIARRTAFLEERKADALRREATIPFYKYSPTKDSVRYEEALKGPAEALGRAEKAHAEQLAKLPGLRRKEILRRARTHALPAGAAGLGAGALGGTATSRKKEQR